MNPYIKEIRKTLNQIKKNQEEKIHRIEKALLHNNFSGDRCIAYFTESISLTTSNEDEYVVIGNFHIMNIGSGIIHQPIIYLEIKGDSDFHFSGKFSLGEGKGNPDIFEWERIKTKGEPKKEYCFRPLKINKIAPGENLVFSNFQLRFSHCEKLLLSLEGYVYYEENREGIRALNSISFTI
ncbi:hypothetical protein J6TS2_03620 [Heyndrickxia sporothermodurans]|nr:hypothetical protein J6TS2_03620 [Heyndrickxia sporothermodurans]